MPKVVITHDVADVDTWLKGKDERAADGLSAVVLVGGRQAAAGVVSRWRAAARVGIRDGCGTTPPTASRARSWCQSARRDRPG